MRFAFIIGLVLLAISDSAQTPGGCCAPPPPKLTAWWSFDAPGSPAHDTALFDNAATLSGTTPVAGEVGQAVSFNGSAYAVAGNHPDIDFAGGCPSSQDFVIDLWIKTAQSQGVTTVLDKRVYNPTRGWSLYLYNGRPGFQIATGNAGPSCGPATNASLSCTNETAPVSIANNQWHFVAVRVSPRCGNNAKGTFFVDGNIVHTFTPRQGNMSTTTPLNIGRIDPAFGQSYFKGSIDELEITKSNLTDAEIFAIYNAGPQGKCKPCKLDEQMMAAGNTFMRRITLAQTFTPKCTAVPTKITHGLQNLSGSVTSYDLLITTTDANGFPTWTSGPYVGPNILYVAQGLTIFSGNPPSAVVPLTAGAPTLNAGTRYALILIPASPTGSMAWRGNSGASSYVNGSAYELNGATWSVPAVGPKDHGFKIE